MGPVLLLLKSTMSVRLRIWVPCWPPVHVLFGVKVLVVPLRTQTFVPVCVIFVRSLLSRSPKTKSSSKGEYWIEFTWHGDWPLGMEALTIVVTTPVPPSAPGTYSLMSSQLYEVL